MSREAGWALACCMIGGQVSNDASESEAGRGTCAKVDALADGMTASELTSP